MSSRNRRKGVLDVRENYPTPLAVARVCAALLPTTDQRVLEPSAGIGNFALALSDHYGARVDVCDPFDWPNLDAVVEERGLRRWRKRTEELTRDDVQPGVIAGNPPFSMWLEHLRHSLYLLPDGGWAGFVLSGQVLHPGRMGATDSVPRPVYEIGLRPRVSFSRAAGRGKGSDSVEYSFYLWQRGRTAPPTGAWRKVIVDWRSPCPRQLQAIYEDLYDAPWHGLFPEPVHPLPPAGAS